MTEHATAQPAPTMPPMTASEESTEAQLEVARKQGEAYAAALHGMNEESGAQTQRAREYEVAVVVEEAEGMWQPQGGELQWMSPTEENAHVEVAVRDAADGRFVPGLTVRVTIATADGQPVGSHEQPFLWHPWLYHYGLNWRVPEEGDYRITVRIEPPTFGRHDHNNGKRFAQPVEVGFTRHITPGQKLA